ncbi:peptidase inhibitor family I36 protein [Actinomycetes bacterium KLBMP 9797]
MLVKAGWRSVRRARTILFAAVLAAALVGVATPGAANAGATRGASAVDCPTNALCVYDGINYTGARLPIGSFGGGVCVSLVEHGWGGRVESVFNAHSNHAAMFMNDHCSGGPYGVPGGTGIPDLGSFSPLSVWVP